MEEALLQAASDAGAEVRRGARVSFAASRRPQTIDAATPGELELHLILDTYGAHKTPP
jgi:hypothetical protein